jgi:hypothetical protein
MEEFNEEEFEQLTAYVQLAFPNCPLSIECIDEIEELDITFTEERVIIIKDDRANHWKFWFDDITEQEAAEHINYTVVKASYNGNITVRTIIHAMINDKHYHNDLVLQDSHQFLEGFDKSSNSDIEYTCFFGS